VIPKIITDNAACKGMPSEEFYLYSGSVQNTKEHTSLPPDHVCFKCPVMYECHEWGLHHEPYGTFGGMTEYELYWERKRRHIPQPRSGVGVIVMKGVPQ
jgi:hypothetical protein